MRKKNEKKEKEKEEKKEWEHPYLLTVTEDIKSIGRNCRHTGNYKREVQNTTLHTSATPGKIYSPGKFYPTTSK